MATPQSILQIVIQAVDEASQELENVANGLDQTGQKALTAQQQLQQYGQALTTAGTELTVAGASLDAFYGGIVDAAAKTQESQDSLTQSVKDIVAAANSAGGSSSSYATQVKFLQDKIDAEKASIQSATATLDTHTGSVEKSAAAHAKAAAAINTAQANIQKYQQQLDLLTASQDLVGASADDITAKFEATARANTDLGFSIDDSEGSMKNLFAATKSVPDALTAYQTAMDLARAKQEDLSTATQQVIMAMQGQGRALIGVGINIKDGLSGMEALSAIQGVVSGQAQAYSDTLAGQLTAALTNINKLFSDMGSTQLPMLTAIFEALGKIITAVDNWTTAHPKLTTALLVFVGVLGVLLTILGALMVTAGLVAVAMAGGLSAAFLGIAAAVAIGVAAIVALGVAIAENWSYIKDNMIATWQIIQATLTQAWMWMKNIFETSLTFIQTEWNTIWQSMSDFLGNTWTTIWNTVKSGVNNVISALNGMINALDAIHINIPAIQIPGTKIGTPALNLGFNIPDIPMLAAGGIVYNPILAMLGENGPEAVVPLSTLGGGPAGIGGGQVINIYIQGGNYLDSQGATMIANELAKQVVRQIKVRNYAV